MKNGSKFKWVSRPYGKIFIFKVINLTNKKIPKEK